ncbi:MAG TPA: hybrid sensor histidine kinase/response regulator [Verrucomicrobiales bacterium]|nr:hybrid sensor histidine kinase/response regulator [Verrucomicrobiales bacterium]
MAQDSEKPVGGADRAGVGEAPPGEDASAKSLRVLQITEDPRSAELCRVELERAGWCVRTDVVLTREEFTVKLWSGPYDVVIAEPRVHDWQGAEAVEVLRKLRRDIPVLVVGGAVGEERVAEILRSGVADYVLWERLARLPVAVRRVLLERAERGEKKRLSEERDRFFMLSSDLLCILDPSSNLLQLNPAWQRSLGYDVEDLAAAPLLERIHPEDRPLFEQSLQSVVNGAAALEFEVRCLALDGTVRWLQWRASAVPRQAMIYATVRDTTDRKRLEAQLLRAQRIESIGTLANGIAHDLNNVLTPILMAVEILQENTRDPRTQKLLNTVHSSAQHGSAMVKRILAFSKGAAGEKIPFQIAQLIQQMRDFVRDTFPATVEIQTSAPADLWMVKGDSTQLHQVLLNLCVNARDAMPQGGKIVIEASNRELDECYARLHLDARPGPYVLLNVADTGGGIPPAVMEKIFEPFFTTKETGKGTGLGLSTVLGIIKGHGGFINVYSEPGRGTRFSIYLPAIPCEKPAPPRPPAPVLHRGQGECILVIDDEASFREISRSILEKHGYRVLTAAEGNEALSVMGQHRGQIHLAITDMMMPVLDGSATMRGLRKIDPQIRLIATSGMPVGERFQPLGTAERIPFLLKPYSALRLLEAAHDALVSKLERVLAP